MTEACKPTAWHSERAPRFQRLGQEMIWSTLLIPAAVPCGIGSSVKERTYSRQIIGLRHDDIDRASVPDAGTEGEAQDAADHWGI